MKIAAAPVARRGSAVAPRIAAAHLRWRMWQRDPGCDSTMMMLGAAVDDGRSAVRLDGVMVWVADVPATVAFYEAAFGLDLQMMDDARTYAQMSTGETTLAFADETAASAIGLDVRPHRPDAHPAAVQLAFVHDDVAAAYDRAVAAGAVAEVPLTDKPWGQTLGYVRDNNGLLVELSSPAAW